MIDNEILINDLLDVVVQKENFKIFNIEVEKSVYANGIVKYGFSFLPWFCVFIKNKPITVNVENKQLEQQLEPQTLLHYKNKKNNILSFLNRLQKLFYRESFSKKFFLFSKTKECVVKNVCYENEMINIYVESKIIAIAGYALILRPKHLIYKAMDLYALPATRKDNPNKTSVDIN